MRIDRRLFERKVGRRPRLEGLESRRLLAIGITEYPIPLDSSIGNLPWLITTGGDGKFYYVESSVSKIGVFDPLTHTATEIPTPTPQIHPFAITTDTVGNVWFIEDGNATTSPKVAELNTTTQTITEYPLSGPALGSTDLAVDSNGNVWIGLTGYEKVAEFTPSTLAYNEYDMPTVDSVRLDPYALTRGPSGSIWYTAEPNEHFVGEINTSTHAITAYPSILSSLQGITEGPDGNLWFTGGGGESEGNLATINPTTHVVTPFLAGAVFDAGRGITTGPGSNNLTFGLQNVEGAAQDQIGVIDTTTHAITVAPLPNSTSLAGAMTTGLDGNVWVLDLGTSSIGEIRIIPDTTTQLIAAPNPVMATQPVTFTATVAPTSGTGIPTGVVTFFDNSTSIGTATLDGSGQAHLTISNFTVGQHNITTVYPGDRNSGPSTSAQLTEVVQGIPTTIQLSATPNPATFGQSVTLTILVTSSTGLPVNSGSVLILLDDGPFLSLGVSNGHASITVPNLNPGGNQFSARYINDYNDFASTGFTTVTATVLHVASAVELQANPNPGGTGHPITFTASVTGPGAPEVPDSIATVTFFDGTIPIGTGFVQEDTNQAFLTVSNLSAGTHLISAVYSGDANHSGSTSNVVTEQILVVPGTTTTLYPSPNPSPAGKPLTLTATVTQTPGAQSPTGLVTFADEDGPLGSALVDSKGQAILNVSSLQPFRIYHIVATYLGDSVYPSTTSNVVTETINPPDGPRVQSIKPVGSSKTPRTLIVYFDEALHPATAQNVNNYKIVSWSGHSVRIFVKSAVYNPVNHSFTLTLRSPVTLNGRFGLTVTGTGHNGVTDVDGRLLDGAFSGQPGSSFVTPLVLGNIFLSPAVPAAPKVAHSTRR